MAIEELLAQVTGQYVLLLSIFAGIPLLALFLRPIHGPSRGQHSPWKYLYTFFTYASCLPGMFSVVLTAYTFFFLRANLLAVDLLVYFLPIASMIATLLIIRSSVDFRDIPGFDRLSGLMLVIGASFAVAFILDRFRIIALFRGSLLSFVAIAAIAFALFKFGGRMLLKGPRGRDGARE